jgi:endonuclease/exonuclease/phosphatase family metal-dependent hydrolase
MAPTFTRGARRLGHALLALAATLALTGQASAQTLTLTNANDTTLRGGSYANTNYSGSVLVTRASANLSYVRRALLKFDTHNTIPAGSAIQSATLTLTVRGGNEDTRRVAAYCVTHSYDESKATWKQRRSGTYWSHAGGDTAHLHAVANVSNTTGSKITFDVTPMVQEVVKGVFGSRYARFLLVDLDAPARSSYKEYYNSEVNDPAVRPLLAVRYDGSPAPAPAPAPLPVPAPTGSTLKVLHWNLHHGVGTDGKYDLGRIASWIVKTGAQVVSLNEVEYYTGWGNEDQPARYEALLEAKTGKNWYRTFATATGAARYNGNAILSLFPIESADSYQLSYGRSVVQASIVVKGRTVNVFSTHLDNNYSSYRAKQMDQLKAYASTYAEQRIIGGDFNTSPGAGEITRMTGTYYDVWREAVIDGAAVAFSGNSGQTRNGRIDYIFQSKGAVALVLKGARVFDTRDASGVRPSDHRPLLATFEVR